MFTMSSNTDELTDFQKFLALTGVAVLMILAVLILGHFLKGDSGYNYNSSSCETRYDSTACPDPQTDGQDTNWQENLPDASPNDNPDQCGDYSCKQLQKDAEEEQRQIDQQINSDPHVSGAQ